AWQGLPDPEAGLRKRRIPSCPAYGASGTVAWGGKSQALAAVARRCWKHSRQKTGRPWVGLKGTVVSLPQPEQLVRVSTLGRIPGGGVMPGEEIRLALQALQRLGSFLKSLSWKNSCSPAVKTKSAPQSIHFKILSWNSMESCSLQPAIPSHGQGSKLQLSAGAKLSVL